MTLPTQEDTSPKSNSSVQWWVPLSWALNLVKKSSGGVKIIPKDSKDIIACLLKFKKDLDTQKSRNDNPLPYVYRLVSSKY